MDSFESRWNADYVLVVAGRPYVFPLRHDGVFTLVVRRVNVAQPASRISSGGGYAFVADFPGGGAIALEPLRDNTTNQPQPAPPLLENGHAVITVNDTEILTHPGAVSSVAGHSGMAAQARFAPTEGNYGVYVNNWAERLILLGGDLVAMGAADGNSRLLYVQGYGHEIDLLNGDLMDVTDSNGMHWRISWDTAQGVWITDNCVGLKLHDGHTFTAIIERDNRNVTFQGTTEDFGAFNRTQRRRHVSNTSNDSGLEWCRTRL
jgi:hypothetical protein